MSHCKDCRWLRDLPSGHPLAKAHQICSFKPVMPSRCAMSVVGQSERPDVDHTKSHIWWEYIHNRLMTREAVKNPSTILPTCSTWEPAS